MLSTIAVTGIAVALVAVGAACGYMIAKQQDAERASQVAATASRLDASRQWLDKLAQQGISTGTAISQQRETAPVAITRPAMPVVAQPSASAGPSLAEMDAARLRCVQHLTEISSPTLAIKYAGFAELTFFQSQNIAALTRQMLERGDFNVLAGQCYFKSVSFTDNAGYFEHWDLPLSAEDIEKIKFSR